MDWSAIIVGGMTLAGVIVTTRVTSSTKEQKMNDRLDSIEKKLDIHNGYAEKFGDIEKSIVAIKKDIEYIKEK